LRKFKYGPLGSPVNVASRIQGATRYLNVRILITGSTEKPIRNTFVCRRVCTLKVVNVQEAVEVYKLIVNGENAATTMAATCDESLLFL